MPPSLLTLHPIGVIKTPHKAKYAAPRQPATSQSPSVGVITLEAGKDFEQALEDLAGFEYIWVLFWFHENATWKPKVLPPHGGRRKRGLFATRSPHRPNPIGLSLCRLLEVKGRTLRVENPDMLDGTPILDIKPYLPHAEAIPGVRDGWIGESSETSIPKRPVELTAEVRTKLHELPDDERRELVTYLTGVLGRDPTPHPYRRIRKVEENSWEIAVRRWRFQFVVGDDAIRITSIARSAGQREGK